MKISTTQVFILLFALLSYSSYAGSGTVIVPGNRTPAVFHMDPDVKEGDYLPNTIIFRMQSQYRQSCNEESIALQPLQNYFKSLGAQNVAKLFPHHAQPQQEKNSLGQPLVDLSLIYSFQYSADVNLEDAINQLLSLGYVEYAEPWYIPKAQLLTPDDPKLTSQYHLKGPVKGSINILGAWDLTTGDTTVVIGIVDTGTQLDHPDLAANIKFNYADPIDGIDNDSDGYVDNFRGWDLGMNDNNPTWQGDAHGVHTSGDACAVTNNTVGVASPGFNCKFLPVKTADASGNFVNSYLGIVYAADHGCTIINCSFGGSSFSQANQDIINYAALNKNCLVLGAGGNTGLESKFYPSSYDHIYRVAWTDNQDAKASVPPGGSTYGFDVDWAAPGKDVYSTTSGGGYTTLSGSSMACPISAGAAGLIQSYFHYTNAFQIGERLKMTCDPLPNVPEYTAGKFGKGRINVYQALTLPAKSVRMDPILVTDNNDNTFTPNEVLYISGLFTNYLDAVSGNCMATLSVASSPAYATILKGTANIGALNTLDTTNNYSDPFQVQITSNAPTKKTVITFRITYSDGTWTTDQYFDITINVSTTTDIKESASLNGVWMLPVPNPALHNVMIKYKVPSAEMVSLKILNSMGDVVIEKKEKNMQAGNHEENLDVTGLSAGIYFCQLKAGSSFATAKLVITQ